MEKKYYRNGKLSYYCNHKNYLLHGIQKIYDDYGDIIIHYICYKDKQQGIEIIFN